jgi:hypothetical protein
MAELEKIQEKTEKWSSFQKGYNIASKNFVHVVGTNLSLFICILLPIILIGFIWTDFGRPQISFKIISDGIVTVALFVIGEIMMTRIGATGGKLDNEYVTAKGEYDTILKRVNEEIGTMFVPVFCEWQIDVEMAQAVSTRLRYLRLTREEWERTRAMTGTEIVDKYGVKMAKKIHDLNHLAPIELNEAVLLFDNNHDILSRGGVPLSGEDFIRKRNRSLGMVLSSVFSALLTVSVVITLTSDISLARVMYTVFKVVVLLYRMAAGYDLGAKAFNTIEVNQLKAKCNYLRQYIRFVADKVYLKLGDKYGDIKCYITSEETSEISLAAAIQ